MNYRSILSVLLLAILFTACEKDTIYETVYVNNYIYDTPETPITTITRPPYLKAGDKIAICNSANNMVYSEMATSIETLKSWGLTVVEASNLQASVCDGRYQGTLEERVSAMQEMIDDTSVHAIIMACGGYGSAQLLSHLDYSKLYTSPKWIIGYSDVTALHITFNNLGMMTIHGPMIKRMTNDQESLNKFHDALFGSYSELSIATNDNCVKGIAEGRLVGGNLSLIYSLCGTPFDLNTTDAILFIEETGEAYYAIDRMLLALQMSGKLSLIKGVVIGEFSSCTQGMDVTLDKIIAKYFAPLNIPIMYGIPSGHEAKNLPLIMGGMTRMVVDDETATLTFNILENGQEL